MRPGFPGRCAERSWGRALAWSTRASSAAAAVGAAGLTEEVAARQGLPIIVGMCGYNDLVRGCLDGNITGFVKLIFEASTRKLVGAHIVGSEAAEIIHTAALSMRLGARAEDLSDMVFNHPTYSEAFAKAAVDALKIAGVWTRNP